MGQRPPVMDSAGQASIPAKAFPGVRFPAGGSRMGCPGAGCFWLSSRVLAKVSASSRASRVQTVHFRLSAPGRGRGGLGVLGSGSAPPPRKNTSLPVLFLWAGGGGCWTALWIDCHCNIGMVVPAGLVSGEPGGRTFSRCSFSSLGSTQRVRHSHTFPTTTHAPHLFLITFFH